MLFAVDIGNTNIVFAVHDGTGWIRTFRIYSDQRKTSDEYFVVLESLFTHAGLRAGDIDRVIVSSVVPNLTRAIQKSVTRLFSLRPLMVDKTIETGLAKQTIPPELGNDLLCNLAQAHYLFPNRTVTVIDFGTALTFSTVDGNGAILGASIVPGLVTAVNSLFGNTAQLPQVELKIPSSVLGRNSQDSIRSGIMFGYAGMVRSMIDRIESEIGHDVHVIATGGLSTTISPLIGCINQTAPLHTLDGLKLISDLNA